MKKSVKIALLVALLLTVVGLIVAFAGALAVDFNFSELDRTQNTREYLVEESFSDLTVAVGACDVSLAFSEDQSCRVVCLESEKVTYVPEVINGVLFIRENDARRWYDHIGFNWSSNAVTVYLPRGFHADGVLTVMSDTGDVRVPEGLSFARADIETDTGDISFCAEVLGSLSAKSDTGDVEIKGSSLRALRVETDTGDIDIHDVYAADRLSFSTDTGDVSLKSVGSTNLQGESDTGDIVLKNVDVGGTLTLESDTGEVFLRGVDAASICIETETGDVSGSLRSGKMFDAYSATGDVRVPQDSEGGRCEIRSSTGDIEIVIAAE